MRLNVKIVLFLAIQFSVSTQFTSIVTRWVAFVSVCVGVGQRIPLSVLARNPHKGPEGEISRKTGNGREDRESQQKGAEVTGRQNRAVKR